MIKRLIIVLALVYAMGGIKCSATVFALAQSKVVTSTGCPFSCTNPLTAAFTSNNTAGNLIVVHYVGCTNSVPSDSRSNTYTLAVNSGDLRIYYSTNVTAGANTVSLSAGGCSAGYVIVIQEWTVPLTFSIVIGNINGPSVSVTGTVTSTGEAMVAVSCLGNGNTMSAFGLTGGNSDRFGNAPNSDSLGTAYQDVVSIGGSYSNTATVSGVSTCLKITALFLTTSGGGGATYVANPFVISVF